MQEPSRINNIHLNLASGILTIFLMSTLNTQDVGIAWLLLLLYFTVASGSLTLISRIFSAKYSLRFAQSLFIVIGGTALVPANLSIYQLAFLGLPYLFINKLGQKTCRDISAYLMWIFLINGLANYSPNLASNIMSSAVLIFLQGVLFILPLFITLYSTPKYIAQEIEQIASANHSLTLQLNFAELINLMNELRFFLIGEERGYYIFAAKNLIINRGKILVKAEYSKYRVITEILDTLKEITRRLTEYLNRQDV